MADNLLKRIAELEEELNDRCSECVALREKLSRTISHEYHKQLLEAAKKKAYAEGFTKGWQEGRADTDWDLT